MNEYAFVIIIFTINHTDVISVHTYKLEIKLYSGKNISSQTITNFMFDGFISI